MHSLKACKIYPIPNQNTKYYAYLKALFWNTKLHFKVLGCLYQSEEKLIIRNSYYFPVWLRLISARLEPVHFNTEKLVIYHKKLNKNHRIITVLL